MISILKLYIALVVFMGVATSTYSADILHTINTIEEDQFVTYFFEETPTHSNEDSITLGKKCQIKEGTIGKIINITQSKTNKADNFTSSPVIIVSFDPTNVDCNTLFHPKRGMIRAFNNNQAILANVRNSETHPVVAAGYSFD